MIEHKDITKNTYGELTPIRPVSSRNKHTYWLFKCTCGKEKEISLSQVTVLKTTKSCGCLQHSYKEPTIREYGDWTLVSREPKEKGKPIKWTVECICGTTREVLFKNLKNGVSKGCGCTRKKKITYDIKENGCYICTSHSINDNAHGKLSILRRRMLEDKLDIDIKRKSIYINMTCNTKECINPMHINTSEEMIVRVSNTLNRVGKTTPHKRIEQIGMIKHIQQVQPTTFGDIIQTPGPGNVAINYVIFERLLHEDSKYIMVEKDKTSRSIMTAEAFRLREKLKQQPWHNEISVRTGEIFKYATDYVLNKNRNVLLVDACLCIKPSSMMKDGIFNSIRNLLNAQKHKEQKFFLAWTFSLRDYNNEDDKAVNNIIALIKEYNGTVIYEHSYRDGTPMKSICWHI